MRITLTKRCPRCRYTAFYRVGRRRWMRLFRGSALYRCSRCRQRFLVLGAEQKMVEHRHSLRRPVNGELVASIGPEEKELGPVLDIGSGGMSISYIADRMLPADSFTLHLSAKNNGAMLKNLPVTTVSDFPTGETAPFSNISVRRRGLKFENFPFRHRAHLHWLLIRYGEPSASFRTASSIPGR